MAKASVLEEAAISYRLADDNSIYRLIAAVRKGIPYNLFQRIAENSPFSIMEWSQYLHLSDRTIQRIKKEQKSFDPSSSERIVEIFRLYNFGSTVFGSTASLDTWLETENIALGKVVPKTLLDTSFGIGLLKDELTLIEQGILA